MTSSVGALELPLVSEGAQAALEDPIVDALLDFSAYTLRQAINPKLVDWAGTFQDAVPANHRFAFDPADPRGHHVELPIPSLFVWWDDEDESISIEETTLISQRQRDIRLLWVYEELPSLEAMNRRRGLRSVADAALHRMALGQSDPGYSYNGAPAGQLLQLMLTDANLVAWTYRGGRPGRFGIDESPHAERTRKRHSGRDWPALFGVFRVWERITTDEALEVHIDSTFTAKASDGESPDTMDWGVLILPGPDGSES